MKSKPMANALKEAHSVYLEKVNTIKQEAEEVIRSDLRELLKTHNLEGIRVVFFSDEEGWTGSQVEIKKGSSWLNADSTTEASILEFEKTINEVCDLFSWNKEFIEETA